MNNMTLGDHTFSAVALHPEALHLMEFIVENLVELNTNPHTAGFDDKHLGIMADILGQYAAMQWFLMQLRATAYVHSSTGDNVVAERSAEKTFISAEQ